MSASKALHRSPVALCTVGLCAELPADAASLPPARSALPESDDPPESGGDWACDDAELPPVPSSLLAKPLPVTGADPPLGALTSGAVPPLGLCAAGCLSGLCVGTRPGLWTGAELGLFTGAELGLLTVPPSGPLDGGGWDVAGPDPPLGGAGA